MKLRLRGDVHEDIEWNIGRLPAVAELFHLKGQWHHITNVAWAVSDAGAGMDVAITLSKVNPPPGLRAKDAE